MISEHIEYIGDSFVIAAGNWNEVLNMKLDVHNYSGNVTKPSTRRKKINELMEKYEMTREATTLIEEIQHNKTRASRLFFNIR